MSITRDEIKHIAELARLKLSEEEIKKLGGELSSILEYIEMLKEVKTEGAEITAQVSGLKNVTREDKTINWNKDELKTALEQGELENGNIKVKRVL